MLKRRVIAIAGSKVFRDLLIIRHLIDAKCKPGDLVTTGNLGDFNREVATRVEERKGLKGDIDLKLYSSEEFGEEGANERMIRDCDEVIIGRGSNGTGAVDLTILARKHQKPVTIVKDMKVEVV